MAERRGNLVFYAVTVGLVGVIGWLLVTMASTRRPAQEPPSDAMKNVPTLTATSDVTPSPTFTLVKSPTATASGTATITPTLGATATLRATHTPLPLLVPLKPPTQTSTPAPPGTRLRLRLVAEGLDQPVGMAFAGDDSQRVYVLEKAGLVRVVENGGVVSIPFLDIEASVMSDDAEQGLLGLAFHPNYTGNGYFYVNYTDYSEHTIISRFSASDPYSADPDSETVILSIRQPATNHNGGNLAFGPDGKLYIGMGDGGGHDDEYHTAQDAQSLLGSMLRIDVSAGLPYAIPPDNPIVAGSRPSEIWAKGLRNPWRFSFDRATGDLFIADVGEESYEEIDFQPAGSGGGQNYGWSLMEGTHCFPSGEPCDIPGLTLPVAEYSRGDGCAIVGGYVYRGQSLPAIQGAYLYGDFCSGAIWKMVREGNGWRSLRVMTTGFAISSFGQSPAGELYVLDFENGALYRIVAG